jgi:heptosyltransferase-3
MDIEPYFQIPANVNVEGIQAKLGLKNQPYFMLFPESGGEHKQIRVDFWAKVIEQILQQKPFNVLLCGQTQMSKQILDLVSDNYKNRVLDTSAKINIQEIGVLSKNAAFALTLDSFPEHFCCIFCKTITIFKGTGYPFFPLANFPVYLIHNHKPSIGMPFERNNVEVLYQENVENEEVLNKILEKTYEI